MTGSARRIGRGLASLVALVVVVVGVPWFLLLVGAELLPASSSGWRLLQALRRPDDGRILVGLVLLVAWAAWLVFAVAVLSELASLASGRRLVLRLPGMGGPQRVAAGLLLAVVALAVAPQVVVAQPTPAPAAPQPEARLASPEPPAVVPVPAAARAPRAAPVVASEDRALVHTVEEGDDLWSLAERYYGVGRDWRRIAVANPDRLTGGPDRLEVGWRLRIPGVETPDDRTDRPELGRSVVVRGGDTLSALAERAYGDPARWLVLWEANRDRLDDPDELRVGMRLRVPRPAANAADPRVSAEAPDARADRRDQGGRAGPVTPRAAHPEDRRAPEPSPAPGEDHSSDRDAAGGAARPQAEPTRAAPGASQPPLPQPADNQVEAAESDTLQTVIGVALASVGAVLAAGLLAGLASRRRVQQQLRPLGRRVLQPGSDAVEAETLIGRAARPAGLRTLDLVSRAVAAHCHANGAPLPRLERALLRDDVVTLVWAEDAGDPPDGFGSGPATWTLGTADAGAARRGPGLDAAPRAWPALVTLGRDDDDHMVLVDLETLGVLAVTGDPHARTAVLAAFTTELAFAPWADEMVMTIVGGSPDLVTDLAQHNVSRADDVDALLDRLSARAREQRLLLADGSAAQRRLDPDLTDPWVPEVLLVAAELTDEQRRQLRDLALGEPRVTLAVVLADGVGSGGDPRVPVLALDAGRGSAVYDGVRLVPQLLAEPAASAVRELVAVTGSEETTEAPWWSPEERGVDAPDNVTYLGPRRAGWADAVPGDEVEAGGEVRVVGAAGDGPRRRTVQRDYEQTEGEERAVLDHEAAMADPVHPILRLLGPVDLIGASGAEPTRASRQCLEYCGWLLEHPGATAPAMTAGLLIAEGTRRSNMSRLRTWLGVDDTGDPYLPDAYTGRIRLHPAVSSDWQRLQILTARGVRQAGDAALRAALDLVRGAPLADAAPGQWHWAEELRTDMIGAVRDIGVELATRAIDAHDIDLARWAASRALVAAPGDELLTVARIRTEHQAGHRSEVERLTLQLAAQSRQLGIDLAPETVDVLQQVLEGRIRARMA